MARKLDRQPVVHVVGVVDDLEAVGAGCVLDADGRLVQPRALHRQVLVHDLAVRIEDHLERVRPAAAVARGTSLYSMMVLRAVKVVVGVARAGEGRGRPRRPPAGSNGAPVLGSPELL